MTEALFRVGGVYRDVGGNVVRLHQDHNESAVARCMSLDDNGVDEGFAGRCYLADGKDIGGDLFDLLPGELEYRDGQWLPITEQARSPYFAEAVGEKEEFDFSGAMDFAANAAMILRDGPARPAAPVVIQEPAKTSHGPIAGLTVLENRDHRFGSFRF